MLCHRETLGPRPRRTRLARPLRHVGDGGDDGDDREHGDGDGRWLLLRRDKGGAPTARGGDTSPTAGRGGGGNDACPTAGDGIEREDERVMIKED